MSHKYFNPSIIDSCSSLSLSSLKCLLTTTTTTTKAAATTATTKATTTATKATLITKKNQQTLPQSSFLRFQVHHHTGLSMTKRKLRLYPYFRLHNNQQQQQQ